MCFFGFVVSLRNTHLKQRRLWHVASRGTASPTCAVFAVLPGMVRTAGTTFPHLLHLCCKYHFSDDSCLPGCMFCVTWSERTADSLQSQKVPSTCNL